MSRAPAARSLAPVVALLAAAAPAAAQLSPGPLSRAHAALEGAAGCLECHAPRRGVAAEKCLDCHRPLAARIAAGAGLHARPDHRRCETCHIEHHGRDFELVFWGEAGHDAFDHRLTGWPLEGAHAGAGCRDCHRPERIADGAALRAGGADLARTFLGLSAACRSCHEDEHRGQFAGRSCGECHGTEAWRPAAGFDHAATGFPLAGAHAGVACAGCHREARGEATGEPYQRFTGLAFGACSDCHADPHRGQFAGRACSSCHAVEGWDVVRGFDHERTRFPLTGRHRQAACGECHPSQRDPETGRAGRRFRGVEFASCASCHADPHRGRLGEACSSCHSTAGWGSVDRAAFDHERTRFPLRGGHARLDCGACHGGGAGGGVAVTIGGRRLGALADAALERCATCHADPHAGQLAARAGGCAECHTVEAFLPSTFGLEAHQATGFPLAGAHLAVPCDACHRKVPRSELAVPGGTGGPAAPAPLSSRGARVGRAGEPLAARFRFASTRCAACHADPHGGELDREIAAGGCEACHRVERWSAVGFDHAATGFALEGAHARAACRACHGAAAIVGGEPPGVDGLRFPGLPTACAGCHGDPHAGQFGGLAALPSSACTRCHRSGAERWADLAFDHRRDAAFPLEGAHARLACESCHRRETADGIAVTRYKPLPTACEGCHARPAAAPRP